jgi:hypothetical protein
MGKVDRGIIFKQALACGLALTLVAPVVPAGVALADEGASAQAATASASAASIVASGTCGQNLTWTLDSNGTLDISGTGAMDDYQPHGPNAPWYGRDVSHVVVEEGVTSIGSVAFDSLSQLESVQLSATVTSVGIGAFEYCSSLQSVQLSPNLKSIGNSAFYRCSNLTDIQLPESIESLGLFAFEECTSLKSIVLPSRVTTIEGTFWGCTSLESVELSPNTTVIKRAAFYGCDSLKSISIPASVTRIDFSFGPSSDGTFNLSDVYYVGNIKQWASIDIQDDWLQNANVHFASEPSDYSAIFSDVTSSTPHAFDVAWLAEKGISTGYDNNDGTYRFDGMTVVYRQDMAAFLHREAKLLGIGDAATWTPTAEDWNAFTDVDENTPHAEDILWLAHAGISQGWDNGDGTARFEGMTTVKRQDMAAFLHRLAVLGGLGEEYPAGGVDGLDAFTDVNESTPHADDITWLEWNGIAQGYDDGESYRFEGMTPVYRQDMAAFLHRVYSLKD